MFWSDENLSAIFGETADLNRRRLRCGSFELWA